MTGKDPKPPADCEAPSGPAPLGGPEFVSLMAAVGPFEARPHVAIAVSGGADSLALCLLADGWARPRGGRVTALTVDHGLRPGSAAEALTAGRWLKARDVEHHVLRWRGPKPASGVQAAARAARYRLLGRWCREAGVLHLALAHHMGDQAETFLMRLGRGSGVDGLAAMSAIVEMPWARLIRPLLGVAKERLEATLRVAGQDWIEDPSNRDPGFARTGARAALSGLAAAGLTADVLAETAGRMARARIALEDAAAALAATCCSVYPEGYARIDGPALAAAPAEVSLRVLGRVLASVGGGTHMPGREKLERLHDRLVGGGLGAGRTLGGCRVMGAAGGYLVCREDRDLPGPMAAVPGQRILWDSRFAIDFTGRADPGAGLRLAPLGRDGWTEIAARNPGAPMVPAAAGPSLPALFDGHGPVRVPHLNYRAAAGRPVGLEFASLRFAPPNTLSGTGFYLLN